MRYHFPNMQTKTAEIKTNYTIRHQIPLLSDSLHIQFNNMVTMPFGIAYSWILPENIIDREVAKLALGR